VQKSSDVSEGIRLRASPDVETGRPFGFGRSSTPGWPRSRVFRCEGGTGVMKYDYQNLVVPDAVKGNVCLRTTPGAGISAAKHHKARAEVLQRCSSGGLGLWSSRWASKTALFMQVSVSSRGIGSDPCWIPPQMRSELWEAVPSCRFSLLMFCLQRS
jgi:hypothetical protein